MSTDEALTLVNTCPDRGPVLPVSLQPECKGAELTECHAGKGRFPGRVTLANCLRCVRDLPSPAPIA